MQMEVTSPGSVVFHPSEMNGGKRRHQCIFKAGFG